MIPRLYIDEVGNGDLAGSANDDNVRYLSLTGLITFDHYHARRFTPEFGRFKTTVFGRPDLILHRREIIRREGAFKILHTDPGKAMLFDQGLKNLAARLPYLAATVTIDKRAHLAQYQTWRFDPYHYCLRCLVERYVSWLKRHGLRGYVAIEPRFRRVDKKVKNSFRLLYEEGTENVSKETMQQHLLSHDIQFIPKAANHATMQLCDLLAHPSYRSMKFERVGDPEPQDYGTALVEILRERKYCRNPTTGRIDGWGRKWLP